MGGETEIPGEFFRFGKRCLCSPKPFLGELSSAGSERLPYTPRGGGAKPPAPTRGNVPPPTAAGLFLWPFMPAAIFRKRRFFRHAFSFGEVLPRCTFPSTFQPLGPCVPPVVFSLSSSRCLSLQNIRFMNGCAFNFNPLTFEAAFFDLICGIRLAEPSGGLPEGLIFAPGVAKTPL